MAIWSKNLARGARRARETADFETVKLVRLAGPRRSLRHVASSPQDTFTTTLSNRREATQPHTAQQPLASPIHPHTMTAMAASTSAVLRAAPAAPGRCAPARAARSAFLGGRSSIRSAGATTARLGRRAAPKGLFTARGVASSTPPSEEKVQSSSMETGRLALLATLASHPVLFGAQEAMAKGGEFGLLARPACRRSLASLSSSTRVRTAVGSLLDVTLAYSAHVSSLFEA